MQKVLRIIKKTKASVFDLFALPAAIAEGKLAGRYILSSKASADTLILQKVKRKGILVDADVLIDEGSSKEKDIDIAVKPRVGRGGMKPAETLSLDELILKSSDKFEKINDLEEQTAAIIYTSGTTGIPKGVMISHKNFLAENRATEKIIRTTTEDKFSSLVPFFHIFGLADGCIIPILKAATIVLIPQYAPRKYVNIIRKENISVILAIPDQYRYMLKAFKREKRPIETSLRYCISGADKLSSKIAKEFKDVVGITIIEGYGMTETTAAVAINPPHYTKEGSVGIACAGIDIRIVDDNNRELKPFEVGEIKIRGDIVTNGYLHKNNETQKSIKDGWLFTGDLGYRDEEGYFFITDRVKDIIIKSGFNISPAEIENVARMYPGIKDAAVSSFYKKNGKQGIVLYCVVKRNVNLSKNDLFNFLRTKLVLYKNPDEIEFVDKIPRSLTGKIIRKELAELKVNANCK